MEIFSKQISTDENIRMHLRETEIRKLELELRLKRNELNHKFAKYLLLVLSQSILLLFAVIIIAILTDNDNFLMEIIKPFGYIVGGGVTGFGLGIRRKGKNN